MANEWGRKETIVWPPHSPVNSLAAIFVSLMATVFFIWQGYRSENILRRTYTAAYIQAQAGALFDRRDTYRLVYVGGAKRTPRFAVPLDFVKGSTTMPDGRNLPVALSDATQAEGYRFFYTGKSQNFVDASMYRWLRAAIFEGKGIVETYAISLGEGAFVLILFLAFAIPRDIQRFRSLKYGRRLKGPVMHTPKQFNKEVQGSGIGFTTIGMKEKMRIPARDEAHHFELIGDTGTGKTTVLESIREGAERNGYTVEGFAPSSKAAGQLRDAGISATTLQSFIVKGGGQAPESASKHLYMLDESSLASTKQMRAFLDKIGPEDRVLVIGDIRQHQAVDAGRPFQQMQEAGMRTSELSQIMRQKDPELLKAVEHLAKGETAAGVKMLADQGRINEIANPKDRIEAIARDYAAQPDNTLIISPDNRSRVAINQAVRVELQANGTLAKDSQQFPTLAHRSDMTGADRMWAARYNAGDVLLYTTGSKANGIERGSYAAVQSVDAKTNTLTIQREDGEVVSYDPKRLKGVNVYREAHREIAAGERIQFTTSLRELGVANRDLGTVTKIEPHRVTVRMDGKDERSVTFDPKEMRHFDHGYAVTSHSSQGLTTGRIIANMDGEIARSLVNTRLAYVAISRASEDARIYTNDAATIGQRLATEITKTAAVEFRPPVERTYTPAEIERHHAPIREALEPEDAAQFKWKGETGPVQTYQHTETGRNIHIDGKGQFYSQDGKPTNQDTALDRAMPAGRVHSQNEYENSLGLGR